MLFAAFLLVGAIALVPSLVSGAPEDSLRGIPAEVSKEPLSLEKQDQVISYINNKQSLWKAGRNFPSDVSDAYLRRLVSARLPEDNERLPRLKVDKKVTDDYPEFFDARQKWSKCPSISHIYDQGNCGSCWAVAVASVISDRYCIATNGTFKGQLSAQEITSCCKKCGYGCQGGWPNKAYQFYQKHGVVTGGDFGSHEGCQPYEVKPCSHHIDGKHPGCDTYKTEETATCANKCTNKDYTKPKKQDRHFGNGAWTCCKHGAKYQIYTFGPLTAGFTVYEDFYHYKSGIYSHIWGKKMGYHIVRVIGWGKDYTQNKNGTEYWLATNSWNSEWGDKGTFKIKAMTDECNFEEFFSLTFPKGYYDHPQVMDEDED